MLLVFMINWLFMVNVEKVLTLKKSKRSYILGEREYWPFLFLLEVWRLLNVAYG